jgi:SRSO17 transposase
MAEGEAGRTARPVFVSKAVTAQDIRESMEKVREYVKPYQDLLGYRQQREHLEQMVAGLTSGLERKSVEPIAVMHGLPRRGLQRFVGENGWDHRPLLEQQRREVAAEIGVGSGSLIVDGSGTPKKGEMTVGVARQWCGHEGKVDNCVVGVHATYVGKEELATLVGSELYLPRSWTENKGKRKQAYIPEDVTYQTQPEIAAGLVHELAGELPFEWVLGDDEFGRARHFRDAVAELERGYVLDVPHSTKVHRMSKHGSVSRGTTVKHLARSLPVREWMHFEVRPGEKGPIEVRAVCVEVVTPRKGQQWVPELLLVVETLDATQRWYCLARMPGSANARPVDLAELVRQAGTRHRIEEVFEEAKGEVGLDHFEVRAYHGWHHHVTVCQIAHWFLVREKQRLGGKSTWRHRQPDPLGHCSTPRPAPYARAGSAFHQLPPNAELPGQAGTISRDGAPGSCSVTIITPAQ